MKGIFSTLHRKLPDNDIHTLIMNIVLKKCALISLIAAIAILFGFTSSKVDSKFKAIHISWLFTMLHDGELVPQRQSIDVFYSTDYLIARKRAWNFSIDTRLRRGSNEILDEKVTIDSNYIYYVSKRKGKYGLIFDSKSIKTGKYEKIDVDSFVRSTLTPPAFFYSVK